MKRPIPTHASKAGARAFPLLVPQTPDAPGAAAGERVVHALREDRRPTLILWADSDPVLPPAVGERFASAIGRPPPQLIEDGGHFLQEDRGPGARRAHRRLASLRTRDELDEPGRANLYPFSRIEVESAR